MSQIGESSTLFCTFTGLTKGRGLERFREIPLNWAERGIFAGDLSGWLSRHFLNVVKLRYIEL